VNKWEQVYVAHNNALRDTDGDIMP